MEQQQTFFQIFLLILFGVMAVGGVLYLAFFKYDNGGGTETYPIVIWGPPFKNRAINEVLSTFAKEEDNGAYLDITYVEKHPDTMYSDILESIASGNSPDLVILSSTDLLALKNKILPLSFETLPMSSFSETWIEGANVFVLSDGIYARPFLVDPLVMFWNRNIFTNEAIAQPPSDWDTFVDMTPRLSKITGGSELVQSAVAFGEYDNVLHAKEIVSALFMQTGADVVEQDAGNNNFVSDIASQSSNTSAAMTFYTSFSNPVKKVYSWNKTFDRSREAFAADKVAMYVGFASEETTLTEINPNLNFSIAILPQSNNTNTSLTYGNFYGIAILKNSAHPSYANYIAAKLATAASVAEVSELTGLPSVRLDLLSTIDPVDPYSKVKQQSAIMSHTWLEPAPNSSVDTLFESAINDVVAGSVTPTASLNVLNLDLNALLEQYNK